jgi:hypothetical protein
MRTVTVLLRGTSPMSQSRMHDEPRLEKESHDAYERRTWREKLHYDQAGQVFVPPMALKMALSEAAKMTGRQIPGRGKSTFTKHFEAGVLCMQPTPLALPNGGRKLEPVRKDEVEGEWINANADGVRGSGKRVKRCFPRIPENWVGEAEFVILDDTVTQPVFEEHLREAGSFIGIGRFRPRQGGFYGRFAVDKVTWK